MPKLGTGARTVRGGQRRQNCALSLRICSIAVPPLPPVQLFPFGPPFDGDCTATNGPDCSLKEYDTLTRDELHRWRRRRGYAEKDSKSLLKTRPPTMDALDPKQERETLDGAPKVAGKRNRVEELKRPFVKDKQVAKHHAQWWDPSVRETWGAPLISPLDGADAALLAWTADH